MQSAKDFENLWKLFHLDEAEKFSRIETGNQRFAYYTSADVAKKIIVNKEIWLRNATVMNDFSEIKYGAGLTSKAFGSIPWEEIAHAVNGVFPGLTEKAISRFDDWGRYLPAATYLTCLSLHEDQEDPHGRLSMWRAYGDAALIIHPTPLTSSSEHLGVFSTPVRYVDQAGFEQQWRQVAEAVTAHIACFHAVDEEVMMNLIDRMLFLGVIGTKHPGFAEEERVEDLFPA